MYYPPARRRRSYARGFRWFRNDGGIDCLHIHAARLVADSYGVDSTVEEIDVDVLAGDVVDSGPILEFVVLDVVVRAGIGACDYRLDGRSVCAVGARDGIERRNESIAAHPVTLVGLHRRGIRNARGVRMSHGNDLMDSLIREQRVDRVCDDVAIRRSRMRARLAPRHRALELVIANSEIDRVGVQLKILARGMTVRRRHHAIDQTVLREDVDHTAGESERTAAAGLHGWLLHESRSTGSLIHERRIAGRKQLRPSYADVTSGIDQTVRDTRD